jgi:hypothetical protein
MNPLQRAATIRKASYLGAILVLFTASMFWRGAIPLPLSRAAGPLRWASERTIASQATRLEVSELDEREGEAEITGSALRLSLTGSRGIAVTALWLSAIDKQKRNDFHEFETRVRMVTKLQPNFITPWIFQSWNIAYNVSVEMQGSGDMYFYIVRGIQLLAEGERRNKRSPDMRYQIAFYYQNKFGVSDNVEVLRCLYDLSCIPPERRKKELFYETDPATGALKFKYAAFEEFCKDHPHLVRRLRGEDQRYTGDKRAAEKLRKPTPEDVVQFLADNYRVPARYKEQGRESLGDELLPTDAQFPVLPPKFAESDEGHPGMNTTTDLSPDVGGYFTAFKAARAWFSYSLLLLPPQMKDAQGIPVPGPATRPGQFGHDPSKHRVPRLPALVIFRQGAPRAQSYQAEMEQKEGWFDEGWTIDDPQDQPQRWWFPDDPENPTRARGVVVGTGRTWSLEEWRKAAELWDRHGRDYGLLFTDPQARLQTLRARVGNPNEIPQDLSPEQYDDPAFRERYVAKTGLEFFASNRQVTNFPFFSATSAAESWVDGPRSTAAARKALWKAEQARKIGNPNAIALYRSALEEWKEVLKSNIDFLRQERIEEETLEAELTYQRMLRQDDERVREYANELARRSAAVVPFLTTPFPRGGGSDPLWTKGNRDKLLRYVAEEVRGEPFSSPFLALTPDGKPDLPKDGLDWFRPGLREQVLVKQGVTPQQQQTAPPGPGDPNAPVPLPPKERNLSEGR